MHTAARYLFTSERLGFRNWEDADIPAMAAINADPQVMEFFPATQTVEQTENFVRRMQAQFRAKGFCYFAVDELATGHFIGFIGLSEQTFAADFNPCVDIGWRLATVAWGKGYATEGAQRCLVYGFETTGLHTINAMAPDVNLRSIEVMKKIGMQPVKQFKHPLLAGNERLENCVLYAISRR